MRVNFGSEIEMISMHNFGAEILSAGRGGDAVAGTEVKKRTKGWERTEGTESALTALRTKKSGAAC